ncbi:MAG: hypothetical protein PHX83_10360 [Acidobacteriia bacterium]|nr:hypothetical protein [Terriglobia bacterium]
MDEKKKTETGFGSDALKDPRRIVFITKKTSAKVKGDVGRQAMSYPKLILREAIVLEILTILMVVVALFWDAPLEQLANPLLTPNPAKAPWYFLGLQELLHYFPPIVAGVLIPGLVIVALIVIPYFHVNVEGAPLWANSSLRRLGMFSVVVVVLLIFFGIYQAWTIFIPTLVMAGVAGTTYFLPGQGGRFGTYLRARPLSWWIMTWFIIVAIILTEIGTHFRGPGWSWVWPWR